MQLSTPDVDIRPVTAPVAMSKDVVSPGAVDDRPQSAPVSWIIAMTDRVNALWDALHGRRRVTAPTLGLTDKDLDVEKGVQRQERPRAWHDALAFSVSLDYSREDRPTQQQTRRLWRLDSDVEVDLHRTSRRLPSPEVDLSVHQRTIRVCEDTNAIHTLTPNQNSITSDRVGRDSHPDRRNVKSSNTRVVSAETNPRQTVKRDDGERQCASWYSRGRSASDDRRGEKRQGGHNPPSKSPRPTRRNETRSRDNVRRTMRDGSSDSTTTTTTTTNRFF